MTLSKLIFASTLLLFGGCLEMGCASMTREQMETQTAQLQAWTQFAKDNGVMFVGQVAYTGRGGLYGQSLYGIDLGVTAQGFFVFDPSKAKPTPMEPQ